MSANKAATLLSYSIVTTETYELLAPPHDRIALIIAERDYRRWLEPGDPQRPPVDPLISFDSELMKIWRVKPDVGNVENNRPDLIDPIEPDEPEGPPMLF